MIDTFDARAAVALLALTSAMVFAVAYVLARRSVRDLKEEVARRGRAIVGLSEDLRGCQIQRDDLKKQVALFQAQCRIAEGLWYRPDGSQLRVQRLTDVTITPAAIADPFADLPTDGRRH